MAWFAPPDSGTGKLLRLALSGALIILGVHFLIQGYELAYSGDGSFFRPDGNGDHYFFGVIGGFVRGDKHDGSSVNLGGGVARSVT